MLTEAEGQLINCSSEMDGVDIPFAIEVRVKSTGYELRFDLHMWREDGAITIWYVGRCDGNGSDWSMDKNGKYVQPSWFPFSERQEEQLRRHGWTGGDILPEHDWYWNDEVEPEYEPYLVGMLVGTLTEVHGVREFDEISIEMNFVPQVD